MLSNRDKNLILEYAQKYNVNKVILFGSSQDRKESKDIDIGVKGLKPEYFFQFGWELYRDLSKPVDIIDLDEDSFFNKLVERDGVELYNG